MLKKEKEGTFFKGAAYGDTEPLWQDQNVGKVDYESKVPVKLNPRVNAPDRRLGDVPSDNVGGGHARAEDGRNNATTISMGFNANGDVVPDAMPSNYKLSSAPSLSAFWSSYKQGVHSGVTRVKKKLEDKGADKRACVDELHKLGAVSDEEAVDTLNRLDAMDKSKLTPEQVGRYATIGAVAGPVVGMGRSLIQGKGIAGHFGDKHTTFLRRLRHIGGDAAAGAATSGAIPILRSAFDRRAAEQKLHEYMHGATPPHVQMPPPPGDDATPMVEPPVKTAGLKDLWHNVRSLNAAPAHSAGWEHATDVAGLGAMALGSGSHLMGQLKQQKDPSAEESGPISNVGQSALDLGGLATMAVPTIAALNQLRKGGWRPQEGLAGGGRTLTNVANIAGLGALAVPTADKIQAHFRASPGEDPESKMLLDHKVHRALELGGYGALMGGTLTNRDNDWKDKAMQIAGYGALAAPHVTEAVGGPEVQGPTRTALELGGLGALAIPSIRGMASHH